jgi:Chalcone isomerase-like
MAVRCANYSVSKTSGMIRTFIAALLTALILSLTSPLQAATIAGHEVPENWRHKDNTLVLNGAGVREYSFLKIHVYVAALYLTKRETDSATVLQSKQPRIMRLKMLRDISREDSIRAWRYYLHENCKPPCELNANALRAFESLVPETKTNDTQTYIFADGKLDIMRNDVRLGEVADAAFANTVLATWIGSVPTAENLKRALLAADARKN